MRVLFVAGREVTYPRNDVLLRAFRRFATVEVIGVRTRPRSLIWSSILLSCKVLPRLFLCGRYDLIFVGFYGHLLMLPVGVLSRSPILFDAFVSTFDTLSGDRKSFPQRSLRGQWAFWLDQWAGRLAHHILLDTPLHCQYYAAAFRLSLENFTAVPVGCNEELFYPARGSHAERVTRVLHYSSYLPLHGVETVVRAAARLRSEKVCFRLIGMGQEYSRVRQVAEQLELDTIRFVPPVPLEQLATELAAADICLGGHFGRSEKAARVVPGKVYQILAAGRPLIAADTPANRELLHTGEALLCPPGDPVALADAIRGFSKDPDLRERTARAGRARYEASCSEGAITTLLSAICKRICHGSPSR